MFLSGTRGVPYQVFMTCFTKLLKDPATTLEPLAPSDELREYFRAVCQAVDLGIVDSQDRGKDRKREFYERIYPVWKGSLPEGEFRAYQEILEGKVRERMEQERRERERREAEQAARQAEEALGKVSEEDVHARFARLTRAALLEADEAEAAGEQAAAAAAVGPAPELPSMEALADAISEGGIPILYAPPKEKKPCARYRFKDEKITVQLVKTRHSYCLALIYPRGFAKRVGAGVVVGRQMKKWGYHERKLFSYDKEEYFFLLRVKVGPDSTSIVQQRRPQFTVQALSQALRALHAELVRIITGLERVYTERSADSEGDEAPG